MAKKVETLEGRALKIAARCMIQAGLCRYDDIRKCRRICCPTEDTCEVCILGWLKNKARKELT